MLPSGIKLLPEPKLLFISDIMCHSPGSNCMGSVQVPAYKFQLYTFEIAGTSPNG